MPSLKDRDRERHKVGEQKLDGAECKRKTGDEKRKAMKEEEWSPQIGRRECFTKDRVRKSILRPSIFQASPHIKVGRQQIGFRQSSLLCLAFTHTMATSFCCGDAASATRHSFSLELAKRSSVCEDVASASLLHVKCEQMQLTQMWQVDQSCLVCGENERHWFFCFCW